MLAAGRLGVEDRAALERRLRDRARRQPAEVVRRAEQDVAQRRPSREIATPQSFGHSLDHHPDRLQRPVAGAADAGRRGRACRRCSRASRGSSRSPGRTFGTPGRVGGERLGGDPALGVVERHRPPGRRGTRRAASISSRAPGRRLGERRAAAPARSSPSRSTACSSAVEQPLAGARGVLADPEDGDDDVLGEELEVDVVALAHQPRDPVAGGAGAADVDDEAQRVVGGDARAADDPLVEHVEAGDLADPLAQLARATRRVSASSSSPWTAAWRRAASSERGRAARSGSSTRSGSRRGRRSARRCGSPSPRWRIADWVRLPTILWVEERTTSAPQLERRRPAAPARSAGARPRPRRRSAARRARGRPRRARRRRRRRRSRSGETIDRRDRVGRRVERRARAPRASGSGRSPSSGSISGATKRRPQAGEHEPVDRSRSGRCAARRPARRRGASARQIAWFPCEPPLTQEPAAPRAPGLGGEPLRVLERGRRGSGPTSMPSIPAGMSRSQRPLADRLAQRRVGARAALVAGDVEAARVRGRRRRRRASR